MLCWEITLLQVGNLGPVDDLQVHAVQLQSNSSSCLKGQCIEAYCWCVQASLQKMQTARSGRA